MKSGDGIYFIEKEKSILLWIAHANHCSVVKSLFCNQNFFS
jgi:hypothetical protein